MNLINVVNNVVYVVYILLTVASFVVVLLHFFKKYTILNSLNLLDNGLSSLSIIPFVIFLMMSYTSSAYCTSDNFMDGLSLGAVLTIVCIVFAIIAMVYNIIAQWHKNLPHT